MRNFENWETQDIEMTFGIQELRQMHLLDKWLSSKTSYNHSEKQIIENLKTKLLENADFWNEDELKLQFIAPLLLVVSYDDPNYKVFSQRSLSAKINDIEIGGKVDFMLAKGKQKPIQPYFFIHEYKQENKKGSSDPKGQLLAELLVAQMKNRKKFPIYGAYVVGRHWFFLILEDKNYAVSNAFNASDDSIYQIIAILRKIKEYIPNWIKLTSV